MAQYGGISVKLATNNHHLSGRALKGFQSQKVKGQGRSASSTIVMEVYISKV